MAKIHSRLIRLAFLALVAGAAAITPAQQRGGRLPTGGPGRVGEMPGQGHLPPIVDLKPSIQTPTVNLGPGTATVSTGQPDIGQMPAPVDQSDVDRDVENQSVRLFEALPVIRKMRKVY